MADYIPIDIVSQILSNLPAKKVVQCTVVCKSWYSFIKTPTFISTHLQKSLASSNNNDMNAYIIQHSVEKTLCSFDQNFCKHRHASISIDWSKSHRYSTGEVSSSGNGLVCFTLQSVCNSVNDYKVVLWNPFIRRSYTLPNAKEIPVVRSGLRGPSVTHGIGFDSIGNDCTVLRIARFLDEHQRTRFEFDLYSLNENSWHDITERVALHIFEIVPTGPICFAEGFFHCIGNLTNNTRIRLAILAVGGGGEFGTVIPLPENLGTRTSDEGLTMKPYKPFSCIAVVERWLDRINKICWFNVWGMRKHQNFEDAWCLLYRVRIRDEVPWFLGFGTNEETLYECKKAVFSCAPLSQRTKVHGNRYFGCYSLLDSYVPCLVLLDRGKNEQAIESEQIIHSECRACSRCS